MLDRTDFASWQKRIRLYCRGKENGVNILKSIDEGPYRMGKVRETLAESIEGAPQFSPERLRVYSDLTPEEKDRYNVKMLLEGSELTKEDRESQLYDDFEHFRHHKGESIHNYYVRFTKLINDMRNIKMTMSRLQLNSKFVNNMLPEWGRFMTAVKLNRGLRDSNYDQLYAYLKQHETHAHENKMILERFSQPTVDPLALIGQGVNPRGGNVAGYGGAHTRVGNVNPGQARPADDCDAFDSDMDEVPTAQTMFMANLSSADPVTDEAGQSYDSDTLSEVPDHDHYQDAACTLHEEHVMHDSYVKDNEVPVVHSDVSSVPTDAFMMMYNDIRSHFSEKGFKQKENKYLEDFLDMKSLKEKVEDRLIKQDQSLQTVHMLCRPKPHYDELNKVAIGYKNPLCLTRAKQVQLVLYNGHEIIKDNHTLAIVHNTKDTLEIAEITRKKMNDKMNDPECMTRKLKSKVVKEQTKVSRPIKALTVYESDVSILTSSVHDRYKSGEGYHAVPPPYTGTFMPPKLDLVFYDTPTINEIVPIVLHVEPSPTKPNMDLSQSHRPSAPIIEDWVSD
uniref:Integrase, catalytic region, zinc finger, CCHC-type, peptidase aspartic, catalytic n=1 Tax=Tanacetum cinerariifolium TaxID=118510 RepID=A0A6L2N8P6_TANCI|nr:hypothetical protein [Tanacetum cinerariifolium]